MNWGINEYVAIFGYKSSSNRPKGAWVRPFALVFWATQKIFRYLIARTTRFSKSRRVSFLNDELVKLHLLYEVNLPAKNILLSIMIYRAMRRCVKALIWLVMGLMCDSIVPVLGVVGYLGALYYFFYALNALKAPEKSDDISTKIVELNAERDSLRTEHEGNAVV